MNLRLNIVVDSLIHIDAVVKFEGESFDIRIC